ncbi:MAG TPA: type III pantothenate kinase [Gammaproteobacteria bacterium]
MKYQNCLLVDIGNSRLKWNVWPYGTGGFSRQTQSVDYKTQSLAQLLDAQWQSIEDSISAIVVANVAGDVIAKQLDAWCVERWHIHPQFVATTAAFQSVKNGYRDYRELGVDRWLAVIAAYQRYPAEPVIVIDCGTATTVDALTKQGEHRAGPIIPGRQMMLQALTNNTANLNIAAGADTQTSLFADNTQIAILSGVNFAAAGALNTIVSEMRRQLADEKERIAVKIIVTGGAAAQLMPLTQIKKFSVEPDLVLIGLRTVVDKLR